MTLIQCIESVYKHYHVDFIEEIDGTCLFKKGNIYIVQENEDALWVTTDEEGELHVIADGNPDIIDDPWFDVHFRVL